MFCYKRNPEKKIFLIGFKEDYTLNKNPRYNYGVEETEAVIREIFCLIPVSTNTKNNEMVFSTLYPVPMRYYSSFRNLDFPNYVKTIFSNNELIVNKENHYVVTKDHILGFSRLEDAYQCYKHLTE